MRAFLRGLAAAGSLLRLSALMPKVFVAAASRPSDTDPGHDGTLPHHAGCLAEMNFGHAIATRTDAQHDYSGSCANIPALDDDIADADFSMKSDSSILDYLDPVLLQNNDALVDIKTSLLDGKLVVIRDAFIPEFAEFVWSQLDRDDLNWTRDRDGMNLTEVPGHISYKHRAKTLSDKLEDVVTMLTNNQTKKFMEHLSGRKCSEKTNLFASWYKPGDFSSPHSDFSMYRTVTFLWNLSKDWDPNWGGAFYWGPSKTLLDGFHYPAFNTLLLFLPTQSTVHSVTPVTEDAAGKRLVLGGWYSIDVDRNAISTRDLLGGMIVSKEDCTRLSAQEVNWIVNDMNPTLVDDPTRRQKLMDVKKLVADHCMYPPSDSLYILESVEEDEGDSTSSSRSDSRRLVPLTPSHDVNATEALGQLINGVNTSTRSLSSMDSWKNLIPTLAFVLCFVLVYKTPMCMHLVDPHLSFWLLSTAFLCALSPFELYKEPYGDSPWSAYKNFATTDPAFRSWPADCVPGLLGSHAILVMTAIHICCFAIVLQMVFTNAQIAHPKTWAVIVSTTGLTFILLHGVNHGLQGICHRFHLSMYAMAAIAIEAASGWSAYPFVATSASFMFVSAGIAKQLNSGGAWWNGRILCEHLNISYNPAIGRVLAYPAMIWELANPLLLLLGCDQTFALLGTTFHLCIGMTMSPRYTPQSACYALLLRKSYRCKTNNSRSMPKWAHRLFASVLLATALMHFERWPFTCVPMYSSPVTGFGSNLDEAMDTAKHVLRYNDHSRIKSYADVVVKLDSEHEFIDVLGEKCARLGSSKQVLFQAILGLSEWIVHNKAGRLESMSSSLCQACGSATVSIAATNRATTNHMKRKYAIPGTEYAHICDKKFSIKSGSSILDYMDPTLLQDDGTLVDIKTSLLDGKLVVIRDAFIPEFAEYVWSQLDGHDLNWKRPLVTNSSSGLPGHVTKKHKPTALSSELHRLLSIFKHTKTKTFIEKISGRKCSGDAHLWPSWYKPGDYSSPHTDSSSSRSHGPGLTKYRAVTFLWNLSKDWDPNWGGAFYWGPSKTLLDGFHYPTFNTLLLFLPTQGSIHSVTPVTEDAVGKRLVLGGWYHLDAKKEGNAVNLDSLKDMFAKKEDCTHFTAAEIEWIVYDLDPLKVVDPNWRQKLMLLKKVLFENCMHPPSDSIFFLESIEEEDEE